MVEFQGEMQGKVEEVFWCDFEKSMSYLKEGFMRMRALEEYEQHFAGRMDVNDPPLIAACRGRTVGWMKERNSLLCCLIEKSGFVIESH